MSTGRLWRLLAAVYAVARPPVPRSSTEWEALNRFYRGLTS